MAILKASQHIFGSCSSLSAMYHAWIAYYQLYTDSPYAVVFLLCGKVMPRILGVLQLKYTLNLSICTIYEFYLMPYIIYTGSMEIDFFQEKCALYKAEAFLTVLTAYFPLGHHNWNMSLQHNILDQFSTNGCLLKNLVKIHRENYQILSIIIECYIQTNHD